MRQRNYRKVTLYWGAPFAAWVVIVLALTVYYGVNAATAVVWIVGAPIAVLALIGFIIGLWYASRFFFKFVFPPVLFVGLSLGCFVLVAFVVYQLMS